MTNTVIIRSPYPNHQDVLVEICGAMDQDGVRPLQSFIRLKEGEETRQYVHSGSFLGISEIPREPATE